MDSKETGIDFINHIEHDSDFNIFSYRNFYNGAGVSLGDINNDGLVDIYLSSNLGANKLYLNKGNLKFEDISQSAGIELTEKWSTGTTMIDINADGLLDIYVCNAGFKKGSDQKNVLFINQGDLSFVDEAERYGLAQNDYSTQAAFFDYDRDGDLDVYLLNNSFIPVNTLNYSNKRELRAENWPVKDFLKGGGDKLLRNDNGRFKDISKEAGVLGSLIGFGLGISVGDVNNDTWPDLYVCNDFFERDYLYINQQNGTFSEELTNRINHLSHSSMGADFADINNDGSLELFVTDMLPDDDYRLKTTTTFDNINLRKLKEKNGFYNQFMHNTLQLNDGDGKFKEISFYADVAASDWSWGALMFDADNDGYNDIFVSNGILHDVIDQDFIDFFANEVIQKMVLTGSKATVDSIVNRMPSVGLQNKLFRNLDGMKFEDASKSSGFKLESFSNGAAYGDLDNDGDLDLVVNNVNSQVDVLVNNSSNNFIGFELAFESPNHFAIGAKVNVYLNDQIIRREIQSARGFQSSTDFRLSLGIGTNENIDAVEIVWPNGTVQNIEDIKVNQYNRIEYDPSQSIKKESKKSTPLLSEIKHNFEAHVEDEHVDFYYERNIPTQLSKEGPCLAKGDFNGDGLEDVYIGASAEIAPTLYQNTGSGYKSVQQEFFKKFKSYEDTYAVFFDCDRDGDLDLMVGSGGNNVTYAKRAFEDRLYENKNGTFEYKFNAIPRISLNTSIICPFDIDEDGDLDLFVGQRSIPGEYGLSPGSHILVNNGRGNFLDLTKEIIPELSLAGMITDAVWADVLPMEGTELILIGEWMAPKILSFDGVKFNIIESALDAQAGWWQSIYADDIDGDGDIDLLLGNLGENFYLEASENDPLFLWINDFDQNGSIEKLITKRKEGKDYPVFVKRDMVDQLPSLKKENLLHAQYANKDITELFSMDKVKSSTVKKINQLKSMVAWNNGTGDFIIEELPALTQTSSINSFLPFEISDGPHRDFVIAGNNEYLLPQFSSIDACRGKILRYNEKQKFVVLDSKEAGLDLNGVARELHQIDYAGKASILALINNHPLKLYQPNKQ